MNTTPVPAPCPRGHRLWIPSTLGLLTVAAMVIVQYRPELDRNFKAWILTFIPLLGLILVFLWFMVLSRFRWRSRLLTAAALGVTIFALTRTLKIDGSISGTGLPRLVWKWSPARSGLVEAAPFTPASLLAATTTVKDISDVPQFFGPNRDGVAPHAHLARDWTATPPKLLWRQPIGLGWSSFAVVGAHAFTQEQRGGDELVTCYDLLSGRLIWASTNHVRFVEWQGGDGPRATPTVDHGQVFAMGATGLFDCVDAATGQRAWSRDVLKEAGADNLTWGKCCSPLVFGETVVVTGGSSRGATITAYRRTTGDVLWKSGTDTASYTSPLLTHLAGKRVILSLNALSLTATDPASGVQLLSYPWGVEKFPRASQPVLLEGDRVFLSAGYGAGCTLMQVAAGEDGRMTATQVWKGLAMKTQFNSAAEHGGFLYGLDDGLLVCVDPATGKRRWKDGRYGSGQTLLVDDLILIQSEPGAVFLAEASPEHFRELGRIEALSAKTWNLPVLAGRYLLIRNDQEAACYELPLESPAAVAAHP